MKNLLPILGNTLAPVKALLIYRAQPNSEEIYIESYDIGVHGKPINAHPLSVKEATELSIAMDSGEELNRNYLRSAGILPSNIIAINPTSAGYVIWHTPQQRRQLLFTASLGIPNGSASVPALIWKATKEKLYVYALKGSKKIKETTMLCHAPFFNIHGDGLVCMGTVEIDINDAGCIEDFIKKWEDYFWNSYFSHTIGETATVKQNIVQLWQQQVKTKNKFPSEVLTDTGKTLKQII